MYNTHKENITNSKLKRPCPKPTELLAVFSLHLNIAKINLHETTFLITVVKKLEDIGMSQIRKAMNAHVKSEIGHFFSTALTFADTKKDRDLKDIGNENFYSLN